jgi:hypothetical protein
MAKVITQHGVRWIAGDTFSQVNCPECNTSLITWDITYSEPHYSNTRTWIAECFCKQCHCRWTLTRDEITRDED